MLYRKGQLLRISYLESLARVTEVGKTDRSYYILVMEIRPSKEGSPGLMYTCSVTSEQWTDVNKKPVTISLVEEVPDSYLPGEEDFFEEVMVALVEGGGTSFPLNHIHVMGAFAEAVREYVVKNYVLKNRCALQWKKLTLGAIRSGRLDLFKPEEFLEYINALKEECHKAYARRAGIRPSDLERMSRP